MQRLASRSSLREPGDGLARTGFVLLLVALGNLFVAALVAFVAIRLRAAQFRPIEAPPLPFAVWIGTGLLVAISLALERCRRSQSVRLPRLVFGLSIAFLVSQSIAWTSWLLADAGPQSSLYAFSFFALTGLHAAHVLGGVVLLWLWVRARVGVGYAAVYWHFLFAVWIALLAALVLAA